jgi:hypothetical protein
MRPIGVLKGDFTVPSINSAGNTYAMDVIGNKSDDESGDSVYAEAYKNAKHIHTPCYCYPTLAAGITLASTTTAWQLGTLTQIVPASTIASPFDIHWISIEDASANGIYELHLFHGATDIFAGSIRFAKTAVMDATKNYPWQCPILPANDVIKGRLASNNAVADTATISVAYHVY